MCCWLHACCCLAADPVAPKKWFSHRRNEYSLVIHFEFTDIPRPKLDPRSVDMSAESLAKEIEDFSDLEKRPQGAQDVSPSASAGHLRRV